MALSALTALLETSERSYDRQTELSVERVLSFTPKSYSLAEAGAIHVAYSDKRNIRLSSGSLLSKLKIEK